MIPNAALQSVELEGIFFGLDEGRYFRDLALGSSSLVKLSYDPAAYWWASPLNPMRPPERDTEALRRGKAHHRILLDGKAAFDRSFAVKQHNWTTVAGKAEKAQFALSGITPLEPDDYERCLAVEAVVRGNPYLSGALDGAVGKEVSIFWRKPNGVRRKARFDILKVRSIVDLKNVSNERNIPFHRACLRKIDDFRWEVQAAAYMEARIAARQLLADGLVYGEHDADRLRKALASPEVAWIWLFIAAAGAPQTWATQVSFKESITDPESGEADPGYCNPILSIGAQRVSAAEKNYLDCVQRFGLDVPWLLLEPIKELDDGDLPPWFARPDIM